MIDFNAIYERNSDLLQKYLLKYMITIPYEELLRDFASIFLYADNTVTVKRLRVIGVKKTCDYVSYETTDPNTGESYICREKVDDSDKTTRVQLYVLNRKTIDLLEREDLKGLIADLTLFITAFKQIKLLMEIQKEELELETIDEVAEVTTSLLRVKH